MKLVSKILCRINRDIENVQYHSRDKRNSELLMAYYKGYETALKETKKNVIKFSKEEHLQIKHKYRRIA